MKLTERLTAVAAHPRLPRRTVRLRLTLLYGGSFLVSGAALLAVTYALVVNATNAFVFKGQNGITVGVSETKSPRPHGTAPAGLSHSAGGHVEKLTPAQAQAQAEQMQALAQRQHAAVLHQLLEQSGIALAIMAVLSIALGWIVAGRILRRLRTITAMAREISATNLHERLALAGPDDELTELGRTFDSLLGRLEASFQAQRQFVANASHELRTPLARQRTIAQVAIADPDATVESLRAAHERVLAAGAQQERLIEALLTLTRGQAGIDRQQPVDLATAAASVLDGRRPEARRRGLDVRVGLSSAPMSGDPRLVERMLANVVDNALRHNVAGGWVEVATARREGRAVLTVVNTGPVVPDDVVDRLRQPFQRLGTERTGHHDGLGLGLSIVDAIAAAHDADVVLRPRAAGGLVLEIAFAATDLWTAGPDHLAEADQVHVLETSFAPAARPAP